MCLFIQGLGEEQRKRILELANAEAELNIGMPAIYSICECMKLWLVDNNFKGQDDGSMHAQMMRRMKEVERSKVRTYFVLVVNMYVCFFGNYMQVWQYVFKSFVRYDKLPIMDMFSSLFLMIIV